MLMLTDNASSMIRQILDHSDLPAGSGVRIAREIAAEGYELSVATVSEPKAEDQIIEEDGARVFVGPQASDLLEDKILDAVVETGGKIRFQIAPQQ